MHNYKDTRIAGLSSLENKGREASLKKPRLILCLGADVFLIKLGNVWNF